MFRKTLCFDDVLLVPKYSDVITRKAVDVSCQLGDFHLNLPIISSPMDTVTEDAMAACIRNHGGLGIIHRYNSISEQIELVQKSIDLMNCKSPLVGAAVGVSGDYLERAQALVNSGANIICIDIAHAHHKVTATAIQNIKRQISDVHIMAGNVATLEGFNYLADHGADSVKVGIGGGSICSTRTETGHGVPTFQSVIDCSKTDRRAMLIADGGIKNSGDIVKCLAAGADAVVLGSLLSGTRETPGAILSDSSGIKYKSYRGMASKAAQVAWRGSYSSNEGVSRNVAYKGLVTDILTELNRGIRSGLSYSGAKTVLELQVNAEFILQSSSGLTESRTHIDGKAI